VSVAVLVPMMTTLANSTGSLLSPLKTRPSMVPLVPVCDQACDKQKENSMRVVNRFVFMGRFNQIIND
jgi:hypothetical protein